MGSKLLQDSHRVCSPVKVRQKTLLNFLQVCEEQPEHSVITGQNGDRGSSDEDFGDIGIDTIAAQTWVYPANVPMRHYQFSIVQTALFANTLVSLPTGLGKTLIAAVVIYNYFRWFPTGKIVFTAPSRPLVMQQIEACHNVVGISQEWTIDMTGQVHRAQRSQYWQTKRVFFVTPQVLEKDIHSGSCHVRHLVCLVVDEAHRASGNYAYCIVIRKLMEMSAKLRILALTATPGSKQATIQAVVDNLRISCLEYKNESDPDVNQYIHQRKLELIQVPMTAESLRIKDALLEILQPLVNRLCGLGVFYSRDAGRLAPFDFITARDKFREAPPQGLGQCLLSEVEACFASAITLYHIFKILFSHGIRPAYEILQQKLKSGPFARLMGRSEKLHQVKLLMQQCLGTGALNPKLVKMEELISDHFQAHGSVETRVIIFTNFRESIKDILNSLKNLGGNIRAMEFIGQSSGRASKGQSQKIQQEVLQKFRAGGYNVIVATSIAEEGLDIMEVDLVICFDANVSPLRMIQRMGRTGRKRDGHVVVLASEGAEVQGYLKKQAKTKVLRKHMHNGGVNSFNFHPSPRMVPHVFNPQAQLIELRIEKFVARGKKLKSDMSNSGNSKCLGLSEDEMMTLNKYFGGLQPTWKASLIAFPQCQLFPTCVYNVKHSLRTTSLLIDTLQVLHNSSSEFVHENEVTAFPEPVFTGVLSRHNVDGVCSQPLTLAGNISKEIVRMRNLQSPETESGSSFGAPDKSESRDTINKQLENQAKVGSDIPAEQELGTLNKLIEPSLYHCLFSRGIVSVHADGYVHIVSPPKLPLPDALDFLEEQKLQDCSDGVQTFLTPTSGCQSNIIGSMTVKAAMQCSPHFIPLDHEILNSSEIAAQRSEDCIISTPEERIKVAANRVEKIGHYSMNSYDYSPRISSLAEQGIVPASPPGNRASILKDCSFSCPGNVLNPILILCSRAEGTCLAGYKQQMQPRYDKNDRILIRKSASPSKSVLPEAVPDNSDANLVRSNLSSELAGGSPSVIQTSQNHTETEAKTPVPQQITKSSSDTWYLTSTDAMASVHKPRKWRRLQRANDKQYPLGGHSCKELVQKVGARQSLGRHQRCMLVQPFVDDEAEVSSDENVSTDEDESDEDGGLDSFIDDRVEPTAVTEYANGESLDMMAIYRKSLLTQSPLEGDFSPWTHYLPPNRTSGDEKSSISASRLSLSLQSLQSLCTESCQRSAVRCEKLSLTPVPENFNDSFLKVNMSSKNCDVLDGSRTTEPVIRVNERKRKLSFQNGMAVASELECELQTCGTSIPVEIEENKAWKSQEEENFDDDPFTGLDLDALEAEAALKSRFQLEHHIERNSMLIKSAYHPTSQLGQFSCSMKNGAQQNKDALNHIFIPDRLQCLKESTSAYAFAGHGEKQFSHRPSFDLGIDG